MEKIIEVKHLTKSYKQLKALDDISLHVKNGEILGLLGPNGSGKSTLIHCLLSLLNYEKGEILMFGETFTPTSYEIKKKIGVVFQDVALFDELTVIENIDYFCGLYITNKKIRKTYVTDAISLVGLEKFVKFRPKQLSGGLLRRLNIACGIAHKPELIFLDEPTVAVDPQSRNHILEGIQTLRDNGATIVYTTHYMEEVEILCDRIIILDNGKVLAEGTKEVLKDLTEIGEKIIFEADQLANMVTKQLKQLKDIKEVSYKEGVVTLVYYKGERHFETLLSFLSDHKIHYHKIYSERATLNDVFLTLTGKELRD